ncbi:MAG: YkgJ family cysteine cluster protein [Promethearchaeota archaeon]|nr:MAG: YkgJ family cysteine cluster protein [Candidatus Lokiarchaeota archaeon]
MSKEEKLRFECTRCGRCCTDEKTLVNVTYRDILRIKEALNLNLDEINHILAFYIFDHEPTEEDKKKMVISPVETERGLAFVGLRKRPDGSCYFYDKKEKKCLIYNTRPNFCRTFPFSFEVIEEEPGIRMKYTEKGKKYCPGINEDSPLINKSKWLKLGKTTIEDLNKNYFVMEEWNNRVREEKIEASVKNFLKMILNENN